jgi:hypothetical protein
MIELLKSRDPVLPHLKNKKTEYVNELTAASRGAPGSHSGFAQQNLRYAKQRTEIVRFLFHPGPLL